MNIQLLGHLLDDVCNIIPLANDSDKEHYDNELLDVDVVIKYLRSGLTQNHESGGPERNKVVQSIVDGRI